MMRAGSVNTSEPAEVLFVPVFSVGGGGEAFCKKNNKTCDKKRRCVLSHKPGGDICSGERSTGVQGCSLSCDD